MSKRKSILSIAVVIAVLAMGLTPAMAKAETVKMRVAGTAPSGHFGYKTCQEMGKRLTEKSGVKVKINVLGDAVLGGDIELVRGVQNGSIDAALACGFAIANITGMKEFQIAELPFLFPTKKVAYKVLDDTIGPSLFPKLRDKGIMAWSFWDLGYRHMTSNGKAILDPSDLDRMKMRIPQLPMFIDMFKAWGVNPVPISRGELYSALQQGVIDGQENPVGVIYNGKLQEVQDSLSLTGHVEMQYFLIVSRSFFEKLPEKVQKVFPEVVVGLASYNRELSDKDDVDGIEKLKKDGMKVYELSLEQKMKFKKAAESVYGKWEKEINSPLFNQVLEAVSVSK